MNMIEIKDLLDKWNHKLFSGEAKKEFITKTISSALGIQIQKSDVEIKNNTVYLHIKPIYKNEIFLKKDIISAELAYYFGAKAPREIR
ncbi:MAG: hypothetical protein ACRDRL_22290 [Sciscionella sp.]